MIALSQRFPRSVYFCFVSKITMTWLFNEWFRHGKPLNDYKKDGYLNTIFLRFYLALIICCIEVFCFVEKCNYSYPLSPGGLRGLCGTRSPLGNREYPLKPACLKLAGATQVRTFNHRVTPATIELSSNGYSRQVLEGFRKLWRNCIFFNTW